jgi:hypothetical protein
VLPLRNGNFESKGGDVKRLIGQTASIPSALYAPKPLELLDRRSCGAIAVHAPLPTKRKSIYSDPQGLNK